MVHISDYHCSQLQKTKDVGRRIWFKFVIPLLYNPSKLEKYFQVITGIHLEHLQISDGHPDTSDTLLIIACKHCPIETIKILINNPVYKTDINQTNRYHDTALTVSLQGRRMNVVKLLISQPGKIINKKIVLDAAFSFKRKDFISVMLLLLDRLKPPSHMVGFVIHKCLKRRNFGAAERIMLQYQFAFSAKSKRYGCMRSKKYRAKAQGLCLKGIARPLMMRLNYNKFTPDDILQNILQFLPLGTKVDASSGIRPLLQEIRKTPKLNNSI